MASTVFQDYNQNNPIVSSWLNDINNGVYTPAGTPRKAIQTAAAWVRFSVTAGVVAIQQSSNIASVVRSGPGVYTITYGAPMVNSANCYGVEMSAAGFTAITAESQTAVLLDTTNTANTAFDPPFVSFVVFGAN
jgi:hypothetical protein